MTTYEVQIREPNEHKWHPRGASTDLRFAEQLMSQRVIEYGEMFVRLVKLGPAPDYVLREVLQYYEPKQT